MERVKQSSGRPPKGAETRKAVTYRLTPTAAYLVAREAEARGCSQSDLIEEFAQGLRKSNLLVHLLGGNPAESDELSHNPLGEDSPTD